MKKSHFSSPKKEKYILPIFCGGFIMVETLVATAVIMMVIPAVLGMATRSINIAGGARNQMIATYLAEEGVEIIRWQRDRNLLLLEDDNVGIGWDDGFSSGGDKCKTKACIVDVRAASEPDIISKCTGSCDIYGNPPDGDYRLYVDSNGIYSHNTSGAPTPFYRGVFANGSPNGPYPTEYVVTSVVSWSSNGTTRSVDAIGYLTEWFQ